MSHDPRQAPTDPAPPAATVSPGPGPGPGPGTESEPAAGTPAGVPPQSVQAAQAGEAPSKRKTDTVRMIVLSGLGVSGGFLLNAADQMLGPFTILLLLPMLVVNLIWWLLSAAAPDSALVTRHAPLACSMGYLVVLVMLILFASPLVTAGFDTSFS